MILREYQHDLVCKIFEKLKTIYKLCVVLATGGGKTVIFSYIAENHTGYTLILVDAAELVQQTAETIPGAATFEAKNKIFPSAKIVVAMSQTIKSRSKKNPTIINHFNLIIIDEAHVFHANPLFPLFRPDAKILGFTATPVRTNRITFFDERDEEWTREELMSETYDDIVCGVGIDWLIQNDFLVDEELYTYKPANIDKLKEDNSGEFTTDSVAEAFNNDDYIVDVVKEYEAHCLNKKTMIFTPNTAVTQLMINRLTDKGYNCKFYDSVNSEKKDRKGVVEWFRNTPDAILLNTAGFVKGFDIKDVQAIILARPTASLSLFIQIAGRGARPASNIIKDRFIFVDAGGNSERFGMWSMPRDWEKIFFNGLKKPKKKKEALDDVKQCDKCGCIISRAAVICSGCDEPFEIKEKKELQFKEKDSQVTEIQKVIYPKAQPIIDYCIRQNQDAFFALKVLNNMILDLFITTRVPKNQYLASLENGKFENRMDNIMRPVFQKIIFSPLECNARRTYNKQYEILKKTLDKYYNNN